jgi:hypothetical protein
MLSNRRSLEAYRPLQPILAPVWIYGSGAQPMEVGFTNYALEDNAGIFHVHELSGSFINDSVNPTQDSVDPAAIWEHFRIEPQAAVFLIFAQRRHYFFFIPNFNQFPRLQIQQFNRRLLGGAFDKRIAVALSSFLNFIEETDDRCLEQTRDRKNQFEESVLARTIREATVEIP